MKHYHDGIGLFLFILGSVILMSNNAGITGSIVGFLNQTSSITGIILIVVGLLVFALKDIETITKELHGQIGTEKKEHRANPKYQQGLDEIEEMIDRDVARYETAARGGQKQKILKRINQWPEALQRRHEHFFGLPHHVKGVQDLPDRGLYPYEPLKGKPSKSVELEVTHYTTQGAFKKMKKAYEEGRHEIMFKDPAGWAYFVSDPFQERLGIKDLRTILGTGLQDFVPFPKKAARNPESEITFKIKVPKERVLKRTGTYTLPSGEEIEVTKYAIAGGITFDDIITTPSGGRYLEKNLDERYAKKEKWKSKRRK